MRFDLKSKCFIFYKRPVRHYFEEGCVSSASTHTQFVGDMSALVLGAPLWWDWTVAVNKHSDSLDGWSLPPAWTHTYTHIPILNLHLMMSVVLIFACLYVGGHSRLHTLSGFRDPDEPQMFSAWFSHLTGTDGSLNRDVDGFPTFREERKWRYINVCWDLYCGDRKSCRSRCKNMTFGGRTFGRSHRVHRRTI